MILKANLSVDSIYNVTKQLNQYTSLIEEKCEIFAKRLIEIGVKTAKIVVRKDTGALESGIGFERLAKGRYMLVSVGDYAIFVEFGTGVVGKGTYPTDLLFDYEYDERRTPSAHDPVDPTIWYYSDGDGHVHKTRGQTANAYMAQSAEAMRQAILKLAKEVFTR